MQHGMEYRIGNFLKGIGCLAALAGLYLLRILLLGEPPTTSNDPRFYLIILVLGLPGIVLLAESMFPVKYEFIMCFHCGVKTEQFRKLRGHYVCEKCGKENDFSKEKRTVEHAKLDLDKGSRGPRIKKSDEKKSDAKKKTKYCRECGATIPRDSTFCEKCGAKLG
jgi:ribosomal protein L40E